MDDLADLQFIEGEEVEVYRNLRKRCWSVRLNGKVIAHLQRLELSGGCRLMVNRSGRERVRRDKMKNVHAWIRGIVNCSGSTFIGRGERVIYDPYRNDMFVLAEDGRPVFRSDAARFTADGNVFVTNPR